MRQLEKKSGIGSLNDSSPIPPICTPSPCNTQNPSQQVTKAPSQPQGHKLHHNKGKDNNMNLHKQK